MEKISRRAFLAGAGAAVVAPGVSSVFPAAALELAPSLASFTPAMFAPLEMVLHAMTYAVPPLPQSEGSLEERWKNAIERAEHVAMAIDKINQVAESSRFNLDWARDIFSNPLVDDALVRAASSLDMPSSTHGNISELFAPEPAALPIPMSENIKDILQRARVNFKADMFRGVTTLEELASVLERSLPAYFEGLPPLEKAFVADSIQFPIESDTFKRFLDNPPEHLKTSLQLYRDALKELGVYEQPGRDVPSAKDPEYTIHAKGLKYDLLNPVLINIDDQGHGHQRV